MKFGILIETHEPETAWNGVRFANASIKAGHEVRIFLMSAGEEIEGIVHETFDNGLMNCLMAAQRPQEPAF